MDFEFVDVILTAHKVVVRGVGLVIPLTIRIHDQLAVFTDNSFRGERVGDTVDIC